jgi:hypothetical protein
VLKLGCLVGRSLCLGPRRECFERALLKQSPLQSSVSQKEGELSEEEKSSALLQRTGANHLSQKALHSFIELSFVAAFLNPQKNCAADQCKYVAAVTVFGYANSPSSLPLSSNNQATVSSNWGFTVGDTIKDVLPGCHHHNSIARDLNL